MATTVTGADHLPDAEIEKIIAQLDRPKANGPALAALLASGIGAATLGLITTLAEASKLIKDALVLNKSVGPLSGKTTYAVVVYVIAFAVLAIVMRGKQYRERPFFTATFALIAIGILGTFPLFYDLFAQ